MLPDPKDGPTVPRKSLVDLAIPFDVSGKLRLPVGRVGARNVPVVRAAVPEAAIDKDRQLGAGEYDIGTNKAPTCTDWQINSESQALTMQC